MIAEELPEGWSTSLMGEVATVTGGGTPTANDQTYFAEHGIAWITPADLSVFDAVYIQHGRRFLTEAGYSAWSAKLLPEGAVLMSSRAPIGYVAIAANELCTNQGFKSFVLEPCALSEFAFHWLRFTRDKSREWEAVRRSSKSPAASARKSLLEEAEEVLKCIESEQSNAEPAATATYARGRDNRTAWLEEVDW